MYDGINVLLTNCLSCTVAYCCLLMILLNFYYNYSYLCFEIGGFYPFSFAFAFSALMNLIDYTLGWMMMLSGCLYTSLNFEDMIIKLNYVPVL